MTFSKRLRAGARSLFSRAGIRRSRKKGQEMTIC
jgi:hypothetical protein